MRRGQKTSAEQVVLKLRQIEVQTAQGKSLAIACREAEISEQSYYRWRKEYGGLQIDQARRMRIWSARTRDCAGGLPPEKWSSLRYGFAPCGGCHHGTEEAHG